MKAAYLFGAKDIRIGEAPDAQPGAGELLLNVAAVGICGSDLHSYLHGQIGDIAPEGALILGHEAAGVVTAIGQDVETTFKVGQLVAIDPCVPCGRCEYCEHGNPHLCNQQHFMGLWPDHGAMRERMVYPASACVPLPDGMSPVAAALLEPLGIALHAIRLAKIQVGEDVLVTGCGAIGLLIIRLAHLAGARRIFASDHHPWRLDMAREYGATDTLQVGAEGNGSVVDLVRSITDGRGVDVGIEAAWVTDTANECIEATRNGGRVVIVGIPVEEAIAFRSSPARRKGLTIKFSRRMNHTYSAAIALAASGQVALDGLATHRFPLDQAAEGFRYAATYVEGVARVMIMPNSD